MSATPRTDEQVKQPCVSAQFARLMELEVAELKRERDEDNARYDRLKRHCEGKESDVDMLTSKVAAIVGWLERNRPDVFQQGLWDAINNGGAMEAEPTTMEAFVKHLRDEHRVKLMCDYSYVLKYGVLSLVAPAVWLTTLREHETLLPDGLTIQWVELPNAQGEHSPGATAGCDMLDPVVVPDFAPTPPLKKS